MLELSDVMSQSLLCNASLLAGWEDQVQTPHGVQGGFEQMGGDMEWEDSTRFLRTVRPSVTLQNEEEYSMAQFRREWEVGGTAGLV